MTLPRFDRGGLTLVVLATLVAGVFGMPREGTAQCSVLDRHPCTPCFCAIAGRPLIISIIDDRKDTKDDIHEH